MIVNAFSVAAVFAAFLRAALALLVLVAGARAIRGHRRSRGTPEERFYLLVAACTVLVALAVVSWPLLYVVLESYVPEWPGVMCIEGVTRIGTGSVGAAAWLPRLLAFLAFTKPLLVFVSGAWLVLHLVNRRDRTGALTGRVLALLVAAGLLALVDSAAETAYLLIPKQEKFLAAGCCAGETGGEALSAALPLLATRRDGAVLTWAFLAVGSGLVLLLTAAIRRGRGPWLALSLAGSLVSLPLGFAFLVGVAAPGFLRTPYHACAYCLVGQRPESLVGIALYVLGAFGVGWAALARPRGGGAGEGIALPLLRMARFGYLGSLLMASVMLVSA